MKKRILAVLLAAAMVLTALPTFLMSVAAETETYLDYAGGTFTAVALPDPLNVIDEKTDAFVTGWNIVKGNVTFEERITLPKDVNLILADGATLTAKKGITVASDGGFAVYAQSADEETMGKLIVPESVDPFETAIGASSEGHCGAISIYGGLLNVQGGLAGSGIGSGFYSSTCGDITIAGGVVNARGGENGSGIGSGYNGSGCGTITLFGGVVNAQGGEKASGIGSGFLSSCGVVAVSGGMVNAQGGKSGAGIGGGFSSSCGTVTISGGVVNAQGGESASGIGSGFAASCEIVTITGGYIRAKDGGNAQPIGKGNGASSITVTVDASCTKIVKSDATYINYEPFAATQPGCEMSATAAYYKDYVSGDYYAALPFTEDGRIGDDAALATWKAQGGDGYIAPLGHTYEYLDFFQHVCARCGDVSGHAYYNNACSDCGITTSVKYYDYNAVSKQFSQVTIDPYMDDLRGICSTDTDTEIDGGYYIVFGNVTVNGTLTVSDDTELILGNGATLTVTNGIVLDGGDLSVYAQTLDTAKMGSLVVTATDANRAAIGGDGDLVVNGGIVTATGAAGGAGIGSDGEGTCGNITLNGGVISAAGGTGAAGIGNGLNGTCGTVTVGETLSLFAGDAADSLAYCAAYSAKRYALLCECTQTAAISPTCAQVGCKAYIQNAVDLLYYEMSDSGTKIGDDAALAAWKAEGGAGYIAIVDHDWITVDENTHKCSYCEDVREHTYVNDPYICDACGYENLSAARLDAKAALENAAGENPSDAMKPVLNNAKAAVDTAETVAAIAAAKETWLPVVELRRIKDEAIAVLNSVTGETPLAAVQAGLDAAENLINAATTESEVDEIKTAVLPVIAAQAFVSAKTAAKDALTAAVGEKPSNTLVTILNDACAAVDAAMTLDGVATAKEQGLSDIADQKTAELEARRADILSECESVLASDEYSAMVKSMVREFAKKLNVSETLQDIEYTMNMYAPAIRLRMARDTWIPQIEELLPEEPSDAVKKIVDDACDLILNCEDMAAFSYVFDITQLAVERQLIAEATQELLEQAENDLVTANDTISALNDTITSKETTIAEKQAALDTATEQLNTAKSDLETAKANLETAKANIEKLEGTVSEQDEALKQAAKDLEDKQAALDEMTENYNTASAALDDAKKALDEANAANEQLKKDLVTANDTISALNDTITSKETTIAEKQAALDTATEQLNAAKADLETAKANIEELEGTVSEQDEALAKAEQDIQDLQAEIERLKALLDDDPTDPQPAETIGDANGDGAVNMKDVLLLRKYLADTADTMNMENADVNADGDVNMKDVLMLRKYLADMIEKLGA